MINRKNLLGKVPDELGLKDAVHVAIVSLRAGQALQPGTRITMNDDGEAIAADSYASAKKKKNHSFGIADPWRKTAIARGMFFWGVLDLDEVPTVRHDWTHPEFSFAAPTTPAKENSYLKKCAEKLGVSYDVLMAACEMVIEKEKQAPYMGPLSREAFDLVVDQEIEIHYIWSEWAGESGHEFDNLGTECCPECDYPEEFPFRFVVEPPIGKAPREAVPE